MGQPTADFLERVEDNLPGRDRDLTLEAVRAVFYTLLALHSDRRAREMADLLPENLETLWKPAFYAALRDRDGGEPVPAEGDRFGGAGDGADAVEAVRRRVPALSAGEAERLCQAVIRELRSRMERERRRSLEPLLPEPFRREGGGPPDG